MRKVSTQFLRQQHGNAMIELSLVLPVLILMLLGALDLAMLFQKTMIVVDSATQGAEYGAAKWEYASDLADFQGLASSLSAYTVPNYKAVAVIACSCGAGGAAVSCSGSCTGGAAPVQYAQVTATATLPLLFGVAGLPGSFPVKSVARVRVAWKAGN